MYMGNTKVTITKKQNKKPMQSVVRTGYIDVLNALGKPKLGHKLKAISFFAGGGGLDLGISYAGFDVLYASDIEPQHCETLKHNFPEATVEAVDIIHQSGSKVVDAAGTREIDLMIGGPPCQSFSILGRRKSFEDERGKLVFEYARLVKEIRPRAFILENVPGLLTVNKGKDWEELLNFFRKETGYNLQYEILNAADFGVPQIRKRVFLIGFREKTDFHYPKPTHFSQENIHIQKQFPWVTSYEALENINHLPNHQIRIHGDKVRNRYKDIPQGGRDGVDRTDRLHPEMPSGTVIVGSSGGGGRPFIHHNHPRHITVREAARLQSFPDWYEFKNTATWQYRAVGNAVPVLMAKAVGESIKIALNS